MLACDVVNQFHDQYRFADARAAKQTDLTALGIGRDQIDDLDARFQYFRCALLLVISGRGPVNRPTLRGFGCGLIVNRIAQQVEHSAQRFLAHRHRDRLAHIYRRHAAAQAVRGIHGDATHHVIADMLRNLGGDLCAVVINLNRI